MGTPIPQEGTSSNRYTILGRLSGGGMADIFLARSASDAGVERYVVLKRVLAERSRDPHFATMFLDEARLAAQLQHPNIAQVHDIGKLGGSYFYTMEYVHGEDVRHVLQRLSALRRTLPVNLALHIAAGALGGLQHAHTRTGSDGKPLGVIHRDVSPSNVMVSFEGGIKLLDFGVAKAAQRSTESRAGTIKGKIMYLSPEQCQGNSIDRRSDIYSLGIVLHEMLTGKRLYKRETDFQTMMAIVNEPVAAPSTLRPDVSPAVDAIVATALSKDPATRYASAMDMIEAIETVAAREGQVLSVTAAGKFMRELFGERPEPWLELAAREEDAKLVTVTGESVDSLDVLSGVAIAAAFSPSGAVAAEQALEAQLDQAPPIGRAPEPELSPGSSLPLPSGATPSAPLPVVASSSHPGVASAPHPGVASAPHAIGASPSVPHAGASPSAPQEVPIVAASGERLALPLPAPLATPIHMAVVAGPNATTTIGVAPAIPASGGYPMPSEPAGTKASSGGYPMAPDFVAEMRAAKGAAAEPAPVPRRRGVVIAVSALTVVLVIAIIMKLAGGSRTSEPTTGPPTTGGGSAAALAGSDPTSNAVGSSAIAAGSDVTATTGSNAAAIGSGASATIGSNAAATGSNAAATTGSNTTTKTGSNATASTGSGANTATGSNAIAVTGSNATGSNTPPIGSNAGSAAEPATIASAFAAGNWAATLDRCAHRPSPLGSDQAHCGIAACNAKQRGVALAYFQAASGPAALTIERACKDHGITLRAQRTTPPKNPCDDKQFREQNPLKCQ